MSAGTSGKHPPTATEADRQAFHFDYSQNTIKFAGKTIRLTPHEADILQILLDNRACPTPMGLLIQRVYGASEPKAAAASMRVAIHSLRGKIQQAGIIIHTARKIGYTIDATNIPDLNRRLSDKILLAINVARASEDVEVVRHLRAAQDFCERTRRTRQSKPINN